MAAMMPLVSDYTRHGDLVVDPCCGGGTTGVAARQLGRRSIMIDRSREHCDIAVRRIRAAREQVLLPAPSGRAAEQIELGIGGVS